MVNLYLNPKIIYHRDNLLHYICRIISKEVNGNDTITGKDISSNPNLWKYGKVLLLINNKINFIAYQQDFEREIIKSFPFYFPEEFFRLYTQKIIRYSYIYKKILPRIKQKQKTVLLSGINLIEKKYNIKFDDYIDTIKHLFIWFLGIKNTGLNSVGFDVKNKETFYINKERFKGTQVIPTLEAISRDIRGFYEEFNIKRKDEIDNDLFCYFQSIFDYPIFKNDIEFCIIDFKFLVEGVCSGLIWKIESIIKNNSKINHNMQEIRGQYGGLLEEYFAFLMNKIFPDINLTYNQEGSPDAVLEVNYNNNNYIIVFEFTTKFYKISSLYNRASENFKNDLTRMLFSNKRNDKGKFINLDKYTADYKKQNKIVIPILVTESWLGDYDLLNRIDNILNMEIQKHNLKNLIKFKPLILSLDDLETFWAISTKGKEKKEFISLLKIWGKAQKGNYLYNFASFVSEEGRFNNQEYLSFFDAHNLAN